MMCGYIYPVVNMWCGYIRWSIWCGYIWWSIWCGYIWCIDILLSVLKLIIKSISDSDGLAIVTEMHEMEEGAGMTKRQTADSYNPSKLG